MSLYGTKRQATADPLTPHTRAWTTNKHIQSLTTQTPTKHQEPQTDVKTNRETHRQRDALCLVTVTDFFLSKVISNTPTVTRLREVFPGILCVISVGGMIIRTDSHFRTCVRVHLLIFVTTYLKMGAVVLFAYRPLQICVWL